MISREIRSHRGFTFVELLVVVAILAIVWVAGISIFSSMASREAAESIVNPVKTRLADLENSITKHEKSSYRVVLAVGATAMEIHSDPIGPEQSVMNWDTGDGTFDFRHAGNRLWLTTTSVDRKILRHTTASWELTEIVHFPAGPHEIYTISVDWGRSESRTRIDFVPFDSTQGFFATETDGARIAGIQSGGVTMTGIVIENMWAGRSIHPINSSTTLSGATIDLEVRGKSIPFLIP